MSLDQYEVLETLGTGSFGTVSKIRRKSDHRILVWKEINFGGMSEKEKSQLVAEVNILRELRNPFVVRYHDRIVDKPRTRLYIIMEYCAGGDLGKIIKKSLKERTVIEEKFIWKIFAQSILALKECHRRQENSNGNVVGGGGGAAGGGGGGGNGGGGGGDYKPILHRDLKPANILLDSEQNIKIGDFGLAKELNSQSTLAKTNVGTPFYMAPEIINEKDYDEKSDIWSLGCLLYELAALKPPFEAQNAVTLAMRINAGRFPRIPSRYSDALHEAIKSLLQVDPRRRPRVEDLESIPAIQPFLLPAKSMLSEYRLNQNFASKMRELKVREETIQNKEDTLNKIENILKDKEQQLMQLENKLKHREMELQEKEQRLLFNQQQQQQQLQQQQSIQQMPSAQRRRRSSFDRYTAEMMMIEEEMLSTNTMMVESTPVISSQYQPMMENTPLLIIPPDLTPDSDLPREGVVPPSNSPELAEENEILTPPLPPYPTTNEHPTAAVKATRANSTNTTTFTTASSTAASTAAMNNNNLLDRKRGPIPLPSYNNTNPFQIFDENISTTNTNPTTTASSATTTNKQQQVIGKAGNLPLHDKENIYPNNANIGGGIGGNHKLYRLHRQHSLNQQNNGNVQKGIERRTSYPPNDYCGNYDYSVETSPLKKARYHHQPSAGGGGGNFPTTVQIDLDTLLRPRQQK